MIAPSGAKTMASGNRDVATWGGVAGTLRRILHFPLTRIVLGSAVCLLVTVAVNSLILKPILGQLPIGQDSARAIRLGLALPLVLATYYWLFKWYERREVAELAWRHLPKEGLFGFLGAVAPISLVILVLHMSGCYEIISANGKLLRLVYPLIVVTCLVAIEEVLFRGILYRITEASLGTSLALIISGSLFGLMHVTNEHANLISVLSAGSGGLLMGAMFSLTKRLWGPIFFHMGWNLAQVFYGTEVSGMDEFLAYSPLRARLRGPEMLSGGAFGPENSVITLALVLLLFAGVIHQARRKGQVIKPYWRRPASLSSDE